jgi:hypothetical protein
MVSLHSAKERSRAISSHGMVRVRVCYIAARQDLVAKTVISSRTYSVKSVVIRIASMESVSSPFSLHIWCATNMK